MVCKSKNYDNIKANINENESVIYESVNARKSGHERTKVWT